MLYHLKWGLMAYGNSHRKSHQGEDHGEDKRLRQVLLDELDAKTD